jgi:hypothetical protein
MTKDCGGVTPARVTASGMGDAVMARMSGTHAAAHAPTSDANLFFTVLGWFLPSEGTSGHRYRLPTYTAVMPSALPHATKLDPVFDASIDDDYDHTSIRLNPTASFLTQVTPVAPPAVREACKKPIRLLAGCPARETEHVASNFISATPPERSTPV